MIPRLQEKYQEEIHAKLRGLDKYGNVHQVPKLEKIVINMGAVSYTHLTLPTICSV